MEAQFIFQTLMRHRTNLARILENTSEADLVRIPGGYRNNIWWNIAHTLVAQQLLCYKLSGLPLHIEDDLVVAYSKGTFPGDLPDQKYREMVARLLVETVDDLQADYEKSVFKSYNTYTTSAGFTLSSIDQALQFNLYHEGLHLGIILSMIKVV
jgi:hypothetical protein